MPHDVTTLRPYECLRNTLRTNSLLLAGAALLTCLPALVSQMPLSPLTKVTLYRFVDFYPAWTGIVAGLLSARGRRTVPVLGPVSVASVLFVGTTFRGPWILPGTFGDRHGIPVFWVFLVTLAGLGIGYALGLRRKTPLLPARQVALANYAIPVLTAGAVSVAELGTPIDSLIKESMSIGLLGFTGASMLLDSFGEKLVS